MLGPTFYPQMTRTADKTWKCTNIRDMSTLSSVRVWAQGQPNSEESEEPGTGFWCMSLPISLSSTSVSWCCSTVVIGLWRMETPRCPRRLRWSSLTAECTATRWRALPSSQLKRWTSAAALPAWSPPTPERPAPKARHAADEQALHCSSHDCVINDPGLKLHKSHFQYSL